MECLKDIANPLGPKSITSGLRHSNNVRSTDEDRATIGGRDPRNDIEQRRFAAATGTEQDGLLASG